MVVARFGEASPWVSKGVWVRHDCGIWKSILKVKDMFWKFFRFKLGSRREITFWEDRWINDRPPLEVFRNLYSLAMHPMGRISDVFYEEIGEFENLLALLEGFKPNPLLGDSWEDLFLKKVPSFQSLFIWI